MMGISTLSLRGVLGLNKLCHPNVLFIGEEYIVFGAGNSIVSHNITSHQQRVFLPNEPYFTGASAIAFAEGKPNVAFGDNSILPSVCIFDIHSLHPLNFLNLGDDFASTGFISLSFNSDGKYLLGQGGRPGWNLVVWSLDTNQAIFQGKVGEDETPVTQTSFSPGKNPLIAVTGNNIFKIFQLEHNKVKDVITQDPKIGTIVCHLWLQESTLICANSSGDLISAYPDAPASVIGKLEHQDSAFTCLCRHKKGFIGATSGGYLTIFDQSANPLSYDQIIQIKLFGDEFPIAAHSVAVDPSEETCVVTLDNNRVITIATSNGDLVLNPEDKPAVMPFHEGAILSVSTCSRKPLIATCGIDKTVRIWNYLDNSLEIIKEFTESVYCVSLHPDGLSMLIGFGDKLRYSGIFFDDIHHIREFSIRGCRCARFSNGGQQFAAVNASKIQVYSTLTFQLIQTYHRHSATVHSLIWAESDTVIASVGNDGAMYVHRQEASNREDSCTTAQVQYYSIAALPDLYSIYVVGSDQKLKEIQNGSIVREVPFQIVHTQVLLSHNSNMLFTATKDGKVFSYALPIGGEKVPLHCHTGAVTGLAISFDDSLLFSAGEDGVLCIYNIRDKDNKIHPTERSFFSQEVLTTRQEIDEKNNSLKSCMAERDDLEVTFKTKKEMAENTFKNKEDKRREKARKEKDSHRIRIENLKKEKDESEQRNRANELQVNKDWESQLAQREDENMGALIQAHKEFEELSKLKSDIESRGQQEIVSEENQHQQVIENLTQTNNSVLMAKKLELNKAQELKNESQNHIEEMTNQILSEKKKSNESTEQDLMAKCQEDERQRSSLQDELVNKNKEKLSLSKQYEQQQIEKVKINENLERLNLQKSELEKEIANLKEQTQQKDSTNHDLEYKIGTLKKQNQELEKYQSVLKHQQEALRHKTDPLEKEIIQIKTEIDNMDKVLEAAHKKTTDQNNKIADLKKTLTKAIEGERRATQSLSNARSYFGRAKHDLHVVVQKFHSEVELWSLFQGFYNTYLQNEKIEDIQLDENIEVEHQRQKDILDKQLKSLRKQNRRDDEFNAKEQSKALQFNADLIEELAKLRIEKANLQKAMPVEKKKTAVHGILPTSEALRKIEENKQEIIRLETALASYHGDSSRPSST